MPSFEQEIKIFRLSDMAKEVISVLWKDNIIERFQTYFFSGLITYTRILPALFAHMAYVSDSSIIIFVIGESSLVEYINNVLFKSFPFAIVL